MTPQERVALLLLALDACALAFGLIWILSGGRVRAVADGFWVSVSMAMVLAIVLSASVLAAAV